MVRAMTFRNETLFPIVHFTQFTLKHPHYDTINCMKHMVDL